MDTTIRGINKSCDKMNKHLIVSGIVVLLICVGLSGCTDEVGLTNIGDISANPENYLGREVKVKGSVVLSYMIVDDNGHGLYIKTDKTLQGNYYLTGIIRYGNPMVGFGEMYYLEVSNAKAVWLKTLPKLFGYNIGN